MCPECGLNQDEYGEELLFQLLRQHIKRQPHIEMDSTSKAGNNDSDHTNQMTPPLATHRQLDNNWTLVKKTRVTGIVRNKCDLVIGIGQNKESNFVSVGD